MTAPDRRPLAIRASDAPPRTKPSNYPGPFAKLVEGREERPLGDLFGLKNFGVNLTRLAPGPITALLHRHARQDELVYVLEGTPTLVTDRGELELSPGMVAGFPAGAVAHQLVNRSGREVVLLEIGDRAAGDSVDYPNDDLAVRAGPDGWVFTHKDGTPY